MSDSVERFSLLCIVTLDILRVTPDDKKLSISMSPCKIDSQQVIIACEAQNDSSMYDLWFKYTASYKFNILRFICAMVALVLMSVKHSM